jgi:antitoxin VapB
MTRVVTDALRERLGKIQHRKSKASVDELLAIAARAAEHVAHPYVDHGAMLYDESDLPK